MDLNIGIIATFKIYFSETNIRKLTLDHFPSYSEFTSLLNTTYASVLLNAPYALKYTDKDGDNITVSSQPEWEEMFRELAGSPSFKILVIHGEKAPEKKTVEEKIPEIPKENNPSSFDFNQIISQFAPFLKNLTGGNCPRSDNCSSEEKSSLFWSYQKQALEYLSSLDLNVVQKGKELLLKMLDMAPNDKITLYNLACAESLLNNFEGAFKSLEAAISAGYRDLGHLLSDKDFNNIKYTEEFTQIVKKLEALVFNEVKDQKRRKR